MRFILTGGQVHDVVPAPALLEGIKGGAVINLWEDMAVQVEHYSPSTLTCSCI